MIIVFAACVYFFLLIHLEQLGNRSAVKSESEFMRLFTTRRMTCSYEPYGSFNWELPASASSMAETLAAAVAEPPATGCACSTA